MNTEDAKKNQDKAPKKEKEVKSKTFLWLAEKIGMESMKFDPAFIEETFDRIRDLK